MINWTLEAEDAACPVDDMMGINWTCSSSCVRQMGWYVGKENRSSGYVFFFVSALFGN
jgi:hypothetical protein